MAKVANNIHNVLERIKTICYNGQSIDLHVSSLSSRVPGVPRGRDCCYSTWHGADEAQLPGNMWHVGSGSDEGSGIMAPDRLDPMSSFWAPAAGPPWVKGKDIKGSEGRGQALPVAVGPAGRLLSSGESQWIRSS